MGGRRADNAWVSNPSYQDLGVLILESRRSRELAALVSTYGGRPFPAPALREVPVDSNPQVLHFARALIADEVDLVVLLTGVGTRALLAVVEEAGLRDAFIAALGRTKIAVRGPKPLAVLRELKVQPWVIAPEPNTWRELLGALDAATESGPLNSFRVVIQEYGARSTDLEEGLQARGCHVTSVPVYRWALPEDMAPLESAVKAVAAGQLDVVLFTSATQAVHFFQTAAALNLEEPARRAMSRMVVASIGPTTSEELRQQQLPVDLEASHPKMGFLAREAAAQSAALLTHKRA